jgi:hypothetical protein
MSRTLPDQTDLVSLPRPDPVEAATPLAQSADRYSAERWGWTLVWFGVLIGGFNVWGFWWSSPYTVALAAVMVLGGIVGMAVTWLAPVPRGRTLHGLGILGALTCAALPQAIIIHTSSYYHTDSAAFDDVSARALLSGHNPFTTSTAAAARLLQVPDRFWTYTVTGGHVAHASYPAGSFLVDVPALALGVQHHVVDWVDLGAWLVAGLLVFCMLPVSLRWLGALLTLTPIFIGMFGDSGTDAAFLPFLLVAVWRWDRFGQADAGVARWMGPLALGAACSIKQLPWFCVPILTAGIWLEARRRGQRPAALAARYLGSVVGVFVLVNVAFIAWSPHAWLEGTLTPFLDPLVADGQGLVALATHGVTGGVNLELLTVAGLLAYVGIVVAFVAFYPACKRVWPLLLPVGFFFSARSLSSYLVDLFPVALVAASTVALSARRSPSVPDRSPPAIATRRWRRQAASRPLLVLALLAAGVVATSAVSLVNPPLRLSILGARTSHAGRTVDAVTVSVQNRTGVALTPHFLVNTGDNPNGFWYPADHRALVLRAHGRAAVTLYPPVATTAPQRGARWLVEAYTASPRALSTSPMTLWSRR